MMRKGNRALCILCGESVEVGGFFDKRLIHFRRKHPREGIGRGWSVLQRLLVR